MEPTELKQTNGLFSGETSIEFSTLGIIWQADDPLFSNIRFLGPKHSGRSKRLEDYSYNYGDYVRNWSEAFIVDKTKVSKIIDLIDYGKRSGGNHDIKLFDFSITAKIQEVNTLENEFLMRRKWKALQKLNVDEVKMLGLEKEMTHLKLRYDNVNEEDGNVF